MESLKLPVREIEERFTKSELGVVAWRSQERYHQMSKRMKKATREMPSMGEKQEIDARMPSGLPRRFFNEEGELDLSKVNSVDAAKYFQSIGMPLPIMPRSGKKAS